MIRSTRSEPRSATSTDRIARRFRTDPIRQSRLAAYPSNMSASRQEFILPCQGPFSFPGQARFHDPPIAALASAPRAWTLVTTTFPIEPSTAGLASRTVAIRRLDANPNDRLSCQKKSDGGCGLAVKAPDCGSGYRGFESRQPPFVFRGLISSPRDASNFACSCSIPKMLQLDEAASPRDGSHPPAGAL